MDVTDCKNIQDFRILLNFFYVNRLKKPKFKISNELYEAYLGNLGDSSRHKTNLELSKNDEIVFEGATCLLEKKKLCSECESRINGAIGKVGRMYYHSTKTMKWMGVESILLELKKELGLEK